jgi:hypothetical protein
LRGIFGHNKKDGNGSREMRKRKDERYKKPEVRCKKATSHRLVAVWG